MSRTLTDHASIRRWAEEHGATPACVIGTGGGSDAGMIRFDFEGYTGEETLARISWADWFRKFDESNLALVVDDRGTGPNVNGSMYADDDRDHQAGIEGNGRRQPGASADDEDEFDEDDDMEGDEEHDDDDEPNR